MGGEKDSPQVLGSSLFPKIFRAFRIAIAPSKLMIAFSALVIICLAGWIMDFGKTVVITPDTQGQETELQIYADDPGQLQSYIKHYKDGERAGVFSTLWNFTAARFHGALYSLLLFDLPSVKANIVDYPKAVKWVLRYHFLYCVIFFLIALAVTSVAGGGICRIAALEFARGEKPGLTESLRFSTKKFASFFFTPLAMVGIIIFVALFALLLGLIGNIPRIGELIVGICALLVLAAGALTAVVLVGTVAGFNLMFPAVAYDGSDCFDAISRSFSYVYAKPWRMGFYTAIAAVYGAVCYVFVRFFAFLLLWSARLPLDIGVFVQNSNEADKLSAIWPRPSFTNLLGPSGPAASNWCESVAAFIVYLCLLVVVALVVSFVISFYFSANTIIYSLMRNRVDGTALDDIYIPPEEIKTEPAAESQSKPEEESPPQQPQE